VTGLAALLRQWLIAERKHGPSAALLKAILVNGAVPLTGEDAVADVATVPNPHQGFGCVSLPNSIPVDGSFVLAFVDTWTDPGLAFTRTSPQRHRWTFSLATPGPLRLTLAYTDYFARGVQNNLDLIVEVPGTTAKRVGNETLGSFGVLPDPSNNIEALKIDLAPAGLYTVSVTAANLLQPGQHYALAVAGALTSDVLTRKVP
jgi:hypothetical protein